MPCEVPGDALTRRASEPRRHHLHGDHQRIREQHRPGERIAELRPGLRIGGDAGGIVVGGAGDQTGAKELQEPFVRARATTRSYRFWSPLSPYPFFATVFDLVRRSVAKDRPLFDWLLVN
jgi:hypothetical protein